MEPYIDPRFATDRPRSRKEAKEGAKRTAEYLQASITPEAKRWADLIFEIHLHIEDILKRQDACQRELAQKAGMKESVLSRLLGEESNPTLKTICKLEVALGEPILLTPQTAVNHPAVQAHFAKLYGQPATEPVV